MIRVLVADDHFIVREGLKQVLSNYMDIKIIGEAQTCREALKKIREEAFDIVLLDVKMPDRLGLDIIKEIKEKKPDLPVLMLSAYPEEQYAMAALKSGASGYLVKESLPKELAKAIREVSRGRKYISSTLAMRMAGYLHSEESITQHEKLSSRELQVMCLIASGKKVSEIADELLISIKTVSTHRVRALEKMGMKNNIEFARYAANHELIE
jgi:DNA-binding NarL/FixJ family response regulator